MTTSLVSARSEAVPMRLQDRKCEVCRGEVDCTQTSAHLARVHWFCALHGRQFHASMYFFAARAAPSTTECWAIVDAWLDVARETWASRSSVGSWLSWARSCLEQNRRTRPTETRVLIAPDPLDDITLNGIAWLGAL